MAVRHSRADQRLFFTITMDSQKNTSTTSSSPNDVVFARNFFLPPSLLSGHFYRAQEGALASMEQQQQPYRSDLLDKYGIRPVVKQPVVTAEEVVLLEKVAILRALVDDEKNFWQRTSARKTNEALVQASSVLTALSSAIQAEDYRLERTAAAIQGVTLLDLVKCIRSPRGSSEELRKELRQKAFQKREKLRNGLIEILHDIWKLCEASNKTKFERYIDIDKPTLLGMLTTQQKALEQGDIAEGLEDASVEIKSEEPPRGVYT